MPQPKSKKMAGLGNALMNDRLGKGQGADRKKATAVIRTNHATGEQYVTNDKAAAGGDKMKSVTEQSAMEEYMSTAKLAGTDFTAERRHNAKIIRMGPANPHLLSASDERTVLGEHAANADKLTVPRRPKWDKSTSPQELEAAELEIFYSWRRVLQNLTEGKDLLLTPFERNIEVWRQLWRVIERSDLIVQIVDARNPLFFRSEDLVAYVKEVDPEKNNLLLINKADMMTVAQRKTWAEHLKTAGIEFRWFSASLAQKINEQRALELRDMDSEDDEDDDETDTGQAANSSSRSPEQDSKSASGGSVSSSDSPGDQVEGEREEDEDEDVKILTVEELEDILLQYAPERPEKDHKFTVGLVGYPNVGKSSTINALVGAKKVSVSATPGKTKHFQTIHFSDEILLCDCPGLVFPNFSTTRADLVCNGVLPIDECREFSGPVELVAKRLPKPWLEALYGIKITTRPLEEGGNGEVTATEFLVSYARAKGIIAKYGRPDEGKAARQILKDYVNGKLLYCHPPPAFGDATEFNKDLYIVDNLPDDKKKAALAKDLAAAEAEADGEADSLDADAFGLPAGPKSRELDTNFFPGRVGGGVNRTEPFNYKYTEQGKASKAVSLNKARKLAAIYGQDPDEIVAGLGTKKHFKGGQKGGKAKPHGVRNNPYGIEES